MRERVFLSLITNFDQTNQPKKKSIDRRKKIVEFYVITDDEMNELRNSLRNQYQPMLKKSIAQNEKLKLSKTEIKATIDKFINLLAKAISKSDAIAFEKLMNIAYGKPQ